MPAQRALQFVGLGRETTWGTTVVPTAYLPVKAPKGFVPKYDIIRDDSDRANLSDLQGLYLGTGFTPFELPDMNFYPDDSGFLPFAMLGVDSISGAGPYTHVLTLLNTALPASWTLNKFDNLLATARRVGGCYFEEATFTYTTSGATGQLKVSAKGMGKIADTVAKPTAAFSAASPILGWQGVLTLSAGNARLIAAEISLKRPVEMVFGQNGTQGPSTANVGELTVTGKMTFVPELTAPDTELAYFTGNTQPATSLVFTSGANVLTFQMTKTAFTDPVELDPGGNYWKLNMGFEAVANSTDAGTGNSPIKITDVNGRSTAYSV